MASMPQPHIKDNTDKFAKIQEAVILKAPDIGASAFLVYGILSWMAWYRPSCYPSNAKLQEMTGLSERTVAKAIDTLVEHGFISKTNRQAKDGGKLSNLYTINRVSITDPSVEKQVSPSVESTHKQDTLVTRNPSGAKQEILTDPKPYNLWKWWQDAFGFTDVTPTGRELANAKELIKRGFGDQQKFLAYLDWIRADAFWVQKGIDLALMLTLANRYRTARVAPKIKDV